MIKNKLDSCSKSVLYWAHLFILFVVLKAGFKYNDFFSTTGESMAYISTNEFKGGIKVEMDGQPYNIVSNEFVKPGKGQAFNRVRLKHLITGRVVEKTFKSGEKLDLADIVESKMRMLYKESDGAVFMDDVSFEQITISTAQLADVSQWLKEDLVYDVIFYKGIPITVEPPTFLELLITETSPGVRGDTSSGRVMKPAVLETGAQIQVPIFVNQDEKIRVDTRTGEYVSRV
ncbi:MAG: elongation factor [Chlamydiia bacterium]|nr:elongation factor [Chlamydiia bacterium]